jgi:hypothetical protein
MTPQEVAIIERIQVLKLLRLVAITYYYVMTLCYQFHFLDFQWNGRSACRIQVASQAELRGVW